jgi:hypothetical protein
MNFNPIIGFSHCRRSRSLATSVRLLLAIAMLCACFAAAKDKQKNALPASVLKARTVAVIIEPDAGMSPSDPLANKTAREDVEKALMKWGRFTLVMEGQMPDLVITVRRGHGKIVEPTIGGSRVNDRPVVIQSTDSSVRIGGQQGRPPGAPQTRPEDTAPRPQTEVGPSEDTFTVYDASVTEAGGNLDDVMLRPPVWRYLAKDALRAPRVQAVEEFRKIIEEAEKQQQRQKKP